MAPSGKNSKVFLFMIFLVFSVAGQFIDKISETENKEQRDKLIGIMSHDVERIERLITDYSQMLKDEVIISSEKMERSI